VLPEHQKIKGGTDISDNFRFELSPDGHGKKKDGRKNDTWKHDKKNTEPEAMKPNEAVLSLGQPGRGRRQWWVQKQAYYSVD
jgi:hypothetical protein